MEYLQLVGELDDHIESILERQITDTAHHHCGGFVDAERLAGTQGVGAVASLGYAYLSAESQYHHSAELLKRIMLAADFVRRHRRPSGCFDLLSTNFDSAPDTAFAVGAIAPVVVEARRHVDDEGSQAIAEALGELVKMAAPGMVAGGFHTPNHRWVLVAALAQAQMLYPDLDVLPVIESYLGEGIDINADGEYIERSTGTYNAIVNRALIRIAQILTRPELLDPVRRNLDLSFHLLHADATVVTSISRRQDHGTRVVPRGLIDGYHAMAHIDGSGFYAGVAAWLAADGGALVCLPNYILNPQWRDGQVNPESLPQSYNRVYPVSGLWRVRDGQLSATAAAGLTAPFSIVFGAAELTAVKASSTFFATGQFVGEDFAGTDAGVGMHHHGRKSIYPEREYRGGIYWLPIDESVDADNWREVRGRRDTYALPPLQVALEIAEVAGGFDLHWRASGGVDGVPFQIECVFAPGGIFETESAVVEGSADHTAFLKSGYGLYRVGADAIRIGPGAFAHAMWKMRNSEIDAGGYRVLVALMAPMEYTLEIRCGRWSDAMGGWRDD